MYAMGLVLWELVSRCSEADGEYSGAKTSLTTQVTGYLPCAKDFTLAAGLFLENESKF